MSRVCIDLFSGTRSASKYFEKAGWTMDYVEIKEGRDVRDYHPPKADFVWGSSPCVEYSQQNRKASTWADKYKADPDLWLHLLRVVREAKPRLWISENVKGAQQVWGRAPYHYGPYFLWGWFPFSELPVIPWTTSLKGTHSDRSIKTEKNGGVYQWHEGKDAAEKAKIPDALAKAVYETTERYLFAPESEQGPSDLGLELFA